MDLPGDPTLGISNDRHARAPAIRIFLSLNFWGSEPRGWRSYEYSIAGVLIGIIPDYALVVATFFAASTDGTCACAHTVAPKSRSGSQSGPNDYDDWIHFRIWKPGQPGPSCLQIRVSAITIPSFSPQDIENKKKTFVLALSLAIRPRMAGDRA